MERLADLVRSSSEERETRSAPECAALYALRDETADADDGERGGARVHAYTVIHGSLSRVLTRRRPSLRARLPAFMRRAQIMERRRTWNANEADPVHSALTTRPSCDSPRAATKPTK